MLRLYNSLKSKDADVLKKLSVIIDPDLHRDIVSLGFVKNLIIDESAGRVKFDLQLTTPACPVKDQFVTACESVLKKELNWVKDVKVTLTAQKAKQTVSAEGLKNVQNIIAVASCKGGVGKSSIATNLAFMLAKEFNARVGLLDMDIYGPSLPTLVPTVEKAPFDPSMKQQIQPFTHLGVKLMSMGYLRPGESVALRGPMVSSMAQQLLTMTGWGELDYLIIDMPPGTGDIQLTVGQHAKIDGAVVVTTPQQLSVVDVEKGIELWNKMNIPNLAVVENFSFFVCDSCDKRHDIFAASGGATRVAKKFGIDHTLHLPLDPRMSAASPVFPFVVQPESEKSQVYLEMKKLADTVIREVAKIKHSETDFSLKLDGGSLTAQDTRAGVPVWAGKISPRKLRLECKSAVMVDEWTGDKLVKDEDIAQDVIPNKIEAAGRYAVRIEWSDGHHSIYPIKNIKAVCEQG